MVPRLPPRLSSLSRLTTAQREALTQRQPPPPDPPKKHSSKHANLRLDQVQGNNPGALPLNS